MSGPREECGVFGIWAPGADVARLTFFALYALQHRGQESAGIATTDGERVFVHRGLGLVTQAFTEDDLAPLNGGIAIGHNRYSTRGSTTLRNAQPFVLQTLHGPLGIAHNGNITNARTLRRLLLERGVGLSTAVDSELALQALAVPMKDGERTDAPMWVDRIRRLLRVAEGAYSLAIMTRDGVWAVRDPHGFRPLAIGEIDLDDGKTGYVVASESCAFAPIGARHVRDVEPGEIVRVGKNGIESWKGCETMPEPRMCVFEYVYFARPDSDLEGRSVHFVRQKFGARLAEESPVEADVVVGVPDSALPSAIGFAHASGLPYIEGLIKNRYIGRTFIQPDARTRKDKVRLKYTPLKANLEGRRVVLVDDSIVRGSTAGPLVKLLRDGGATEVHVRIASPPVRHPCFMGVDLGTYGEIIANEKSVDEIREHIGADSLAYLSLEGMLGIVHDTPERGYCAACFDGRYPNTLEDGTTKMQFADITGA